MINSFYGMSLSHKSYSKKFYLYLLQEKRKCSYFFKSNFLSSFDEKLRQQKKESNNDIFGDIHVAKDKIMAFPLKAAYKEAKKKRTQAEICMESRTKK